MVIQVVNSAIGAEIAKIYVISRQIFSVSCECEFLITCIHKLFLPIKIKVFGICQCFVIINTCIDFIKLKMI